LTSCVSDRNSVFSSGNLSGQDSDGQLRRICVVEQTNCPPSSLCTECVIQYRKKVIVISVVAHFLSDLVSGCIESLWPTPPAWSVWCPSINTALLNSGTVAGRW